MASWWSHARDSFRRDNPINGGRKQKSFKGDCRPSHLKEPIQIRQNGRASSDSSRVLCWWTCRTLCTIDLPNAPTAIFPQYAGNGLILWWNFGPWGPLITHLVHLYHGSTGWLKPTIRYYSPLHNRPYLIFQPASNLMSRWRPLGTPTCGIVQQNNGGSIAA